MISNIAHQWRQPLSMISSVTSSIKVQKELGISKNEDEVKAYDTILKQVNYLSNTIDDFRNFFRPDKEKVWVKTHDILNKTFQLINLKSFGIRVIKDINDVEFFALENELIQVIINILNNAKDAVENSKEKLIFVNAYQEENRLIFTIQDSGGGIDKEIKERIFEPYFTTKHKAQGTGIGLYMVKEILTRHMGASIEVENTTFEFEEKQYKGAKFTVIFILDEKNVEI